MNKTLKGVVLASAVASMFGSAMAEEKAPAAKDPKAAAADVKCEGVNECKGKGACGGVGHGCAGKNECKGKGWVKMSDADCKTKGGKVAAGK